MSKFKVGDKAWLSEVGTKQVTKTCPICAGKMEVTLILGTGEECILPCDYCMKGYEGPYGVVQEYEFSAGAEWHIVREIRSAITESGETSEYVFLDGRFAREENVFSTKEEAEEECVRRCAQIAEEQRTRAEHIKHNQAKKYSWNAGYHLREAKREEESAKRHREKAAICKARAGESKEGEKHDRE